MHRYIAYAICMTLCILQYVPQASVRDGRGAQRSRVRSTRDGTPAQPARALSVCVLLNRGTAPCPTARWGSGVIRSGEASGTGTPKPAHYACPCCIWNCAHNGTGKMVGGVLQRRYTIVSIRFFCAVLRFGSCAYCSNSRCTRALIWVCRSSCVSSVIASS